MFRIFLDEDSCERRLVEALRRLGFDVLTTLEAGRESFPDDSQLAFASTEQRAVVTGNDADFSRLQGEWGASGRHHRGIIVARQQIRSAEATADAIFRFASSIPDDALANAIYYL